MGKSTTAALFRDAGVPVWDADACVHSLYASGGAAVAPVAALVPDALRGDALDRAVLRSAFLSDPELPARIEAIVHPLVAEDRAAFLRAHPGRVVLCDIPLLFETGGQGACDRVIVVSAPADVQRDRVLSRPGMTEETLAAILARQVPDAQKRARADIVIDTSQGIDHARDQVRTLLQDLERHQDA